MTAKKVLFIVQLPPPIHGASTMNQIVCNRVKKHLNYNCRTISLNFARDLSDLQKIRVGKILKAIAIYFRICWSLLSFRPDIVYFSMVPLNFVLFRDALYLLTIKLLRLRVRPIIHLHRPGLYEFNKKWSLDWLYRLLFRRCTIVHLTPALMQREVLSLHLKNVKYFVIPNSVVLADNENNNTLRNKYNILFLSNLLPHKGYKILVEAIASLRVEFPDIRLSIAGPALNQETIDNLKKFIDKQGVSDIVSIKGKVSGQAKDELFNNSGILALPSKLEYFPMVILEAMSNNVAVITSGRENLSGTFTDGDHLLFVDKIDSEEVAKKLRLLLTDDALLSKIALNGHKRWLELQGESERLIDELFMTHGNSSQH